MKKHLSIVLCSILLFSFTACGSTSTESSSEPTSEEQTVLTEEESIKQFIQDTVSENYYDTDIEDITLNDNLGTDVDGDFVVLVNLTWNVKNSADTTKEMLEMYSSDLAARTNQQFESVSEIAIFWNVPYHGSDGKVSYEKVEDGMKLSDKIFNF